MGLTFITEIKYPKKKKTQTSTLALKNWTINPKLELYFLNPETLSDHESLSLDHGHFIDGETEAWETKYSAPC